MKSHLARLALALSLSVSALGVSISQAAAPSSSGGPVVVTMYTQNFGYAIFKHQSDPVELQKQLDDWLKANAGAVRTIVSSQLQYLGGYYVLSVVYGK